MSDANEETSAQRIARYKEERHKQYSIRYERLLAQNKLQLEQQHQQQKKASKDANSSTSDGPRLNRASRFRAAATAGQDAIKERVAAPSVTGTHQDSLNKYEKDKSSKRKSNLNRSLTSEEVPPSDTLDDAKSRRRRRRFFPPDVLQQTASHSNEERFKSDTSCTAYNFSPLSSPITATATTTRTSPKRSQLSVHMENARRSVTSSADTGKVSRSSPRSSATSSPKGLTSKLENSKSSIGNPISLSNGNVINKENVKRKHNDALVYRLSPCKKVPNATNNEKSSERFVYKNEKLQELLDLTKDTLARVEKLTSKTRPLPRKSPDRKPKSSRTKSSSDSGTDTKEKTKKVEHKPQIFIQEDKPQNHSILKKKSLEEHESIVYHPSPSAPVSILKRKVSQDDCKPSTSSTHTPPVTFSPSVVEPSSNNRKQGILKKRRSLDESQVMRHRSCSPDVANKSDSRSILKSQRRSSLEEITRIRSPDLQIQGILKRKTTKSDDDPENSLNSPQSILKRRSGASSAGSTSGNQHVSITTAVILAAAGGAEMILEPNDHVKPILKKKSIEEQSGSEISCETLKPILKKKSSTDTDDAEDKPRPILKSSKGLSEHSDSDTTRYNYRYVMGNDSGSESEVRPILKQSNSTEESSRFRLSFHTDEETNGDLGKRIRSRRLDPNCTDLNSNASRSNLEPDRELRRPRPISVSELVMNFEKTTTTSTGAIPKKSSLKRNDRSRTQPVTFNEFEASRASLLTTSITNVSIDSGVGKMSSDSAFQSLGDGLELEDEESPPPSMPLSPTKLDTTKSQMKAIVDEAKKCKLGKGNSGIEKYRNRQSGSSSTKSNAQRYSTQPITFDEVQEASKLNRDTESEKDEPEPSKLSLSDRIKMFNTKVSENNFLKRDVPKRRQTRFQTQPVTSEEVESARCVSPDNLSDTALDQEYPSFAERKGILKSKLESCGVFKYPYERHPRSALKYSESLKISRDKLSPKSILKPESTDFTYDEGISSNDSSSDSENSLRKSKSDVDDDLTIHDDVMIGGRFAHVNIEKSPKSSSVSCSETHTSDESSGGREIRSIIAGEAAAKRRQRERNNDGLFKSRSHAHVGDDLENTSSRVRRSMTQAAMPRTIGELQAKLKQSGDTDWRKRIPKLNNANEELSLLKVKNIYNEELSEKTSILAAKKDELNAASKQWKARVEKTDADKFSVAGRMEKLEKPVITINIPTPDKEKRTPKAKRFKGKDGDNKEPNSGSNSPEEVGVNIGFKRSISVPGNKTNDDSSESENSLRSSGRKVRVLKPDDDTFTSFFKTSDETNTVETFDLSLNDLDVIDSHKLLSNKKIVKVQRRREASKNPLRALATRSDIVDEYLEITTDIAERELKRLNVEKLSKSSSFALEALAGLASKEDFSNILLKKCGQSSNFSYLPYKDLMLIHIKGRRHVQTRLVNPTAASINQGDNYILITPKTLYNYVGSYSNVIEQSRACDIVNHIQQTGDMGCKADKCITINPKKNSSSSDLQKFWKILGAPGDTEVTTAGHPDEDEIYESSILSTNMIYTIENNELVPVDEYWGKIPKIEMLQPKKVYVFDFGTEMYVWSGITASPDNKKRALSLAKELWSEGYNYSDCGVSPINIAEMIGDRKKDETSLKSEERPEWALFAKITQHRETILFREKFLDWPDYSRVIKVKQPAEKTETSTDINPCDVKKMRNLEYSEPDFQVEGTHLGRGHSYFDEENRRQYEISTLDVKCWKILESTYEEVSNDLLGHFYEAETFVIRWQFRVTISGRELSGKPSKYNQTGRDRCLYFCWLGNQATINEKGAAALLTVELDSENARQIRVPQGSEQPVFFRLFNGEMVTHTGKSDNTDMKKQRLYMSKGEFIEEASLLEVPCSMRSLRSRSSFILVDSENDTITIWHGCKSLDQTRTITKKLAESILEKKSSHFGLQDSDCDKIEEIEEGRENAEFLKTLGDKRLYMSLLLSVMEYKNTPRLFHFSSVLGSFTATEVLCPYRSEHTTPYPFLQSDLYSASQPALFLLDNGHELWLWQGWWPEREDDTDLSEQTGSGRVRWQAERKAAMQTAINYWKEERKGNHPVAVYSVWAGLEPLSFTNLFPTWCDRDDIAELNIKDGKKAGETISVETELAQLTRTTYPLAQLLQRPLPEGVDPRQLEIYLSPEDFAELLLMTPADFQKLPAWKQTAVKKEKGLF